MPAIGKITLDTKDYERSLAKARKEGQRFARGASQDFGKVGKAASKAGSLISSISSEAGGAFGKLGGVISSVASGPIGILTAALGALVALGVEVWDRMTLSAEEYAKKLDFAASKAEKNRAAVEKLAAEDQGYMDRLKELSEKEQLSNEAKDEAATLIKILTDRYGKLGIEIDKTTGKITGMDEAQERMLEKQRKQRAYAVAFQLGALKDKSAHQMRMAIGGWTWAALTQQEKDKIGSMDLGQQLTFANKMFEAAKTEDDMKKWQDVIDTIEKQRELEAELKSLMETGSKNAQELTSKKRKKANATQSEVDAEVAARNQLEQKTEDYYSGTISSLEKQLELQRLINAGKLEEAERQKIINELEKQGIKADARVDTIANLQKELAAAKLQQAQGQQANSLYERALRAAGRGQEADQRAALESARQKKGGNLTEEEKARTIELLGLSQQLDQLNGVNFGGMAIQTNDLTARGGFQTGAAVPDSENYDKMIADNGKNVLTVVQKIETICRDLGKF